MTSYRVYRDKEARGIILRGAEALYNAVSPTMGPRGRNVIIERPYAVPIITHDGVTVAKYVQPQNKRKRAAVSIIREAAEALNRLSGDGTTTVTVLTYHILKEAMALIDAGYNPMKLWKELEAAVPQLLEKIDELKEKVETEERLAEVATISCADPELGKMIAHLVWQVGADGTVTVEEGMGLTIESEVVEGYTFERGYVSPLFITDTSRNEARVKDAYVYLHDRELTTSGQAYNIVSSLPADARRLLIIAQDVKKEALAYLINLKNAGTIEVVAVKAPGFGAAKTELLEDLATLTGATLQVQLPEKPVELTVFGRIKTAVVTKDTATLTVDDTTKPAVQARIKDLKSQAKHTTVELEKQLLNNRASALDGRVAVIKVGGLTDGDVGEKKDRVDDAVAASIAALKDGIVAGGGVTPYHLAVTMDDATQGQKVLVSALAAPVHKLLENAGLDESMVIDLIDYGKGYDVTSDSPELIDMVQAGIIDPAQVTKQAIKTAVTVASSLLTGGVLMVLHEDKGLDQDDLY